MSKISSYSFKDICTPKLYFENVIGIQYKESLKATQWSSMSSVSDTSGTLVKFYDLQSAKSATLSKANLTSDKVVSFEILVQLMYYWILFIRDDADGYIFDSWGEFDAVLGRFSRGIQNLINSLTQAKNNKNKNEIDLILKNVPEKEGKDRITRVLNYLNQLKKQIVKWQGKVPASNVSTKNVQIKIPKVKTKKPTKKPLDTHTSSSEEKPLDTDTSSSEEEPSSGSEKPEYVEDSKDYRCKCTAPGYEKYYYLAWDTDGKFTTEPGVTINIPQGTSEYKFIVAGDCTKTGKSITFTTKLNNHTPLSACQIPIASALFKFKDQLDDEIDVDSVFTLAGELSGCTGEGNIDVTRCTAAGAAGGIFDEANAGHSIYYVCVAEDKKTLLPLSLNEAGVGS